MHKNILYKNEYDTENNNLDIENINENSLEIINWVCEKGHRWKDSLFNRTRTGIGCPVCNGISSLDENIVIDKADLLLNWDYEKNNKLGLYPQSNTKWSRSYRVHWKCSEGHEIKRSVRDQYKAVNKCFYCAGTDNKSHLNSEKNIANKIKKILEDDKKIMDRMFKVGKVIDEKDKFTVKYPEFAKQWDAEKNGMTAEKVGIIIESERYWFTCENGHSRMVSIETLKASKGNGCMYCNGLKGKYTVTLFP